MESKIDYRNVDPLGPEISSSVSVPHQVIGEFLDHQQYLFAVDLLILSTLETQHRNQILSHRVMPMFKSFNNMLDIGVGNGDLTHHLGSYYNYVTIIDNDQNALDNIQDDYYLADTKTNKILGSILEVDIPDKKYDLILLSHVLYYIDPDLRISLVSKLRNMLSNEGYLMIIFNEGLSRYEFTKHFGGKNFEFSELLNKLKSEDYHNSVRIIESREEIRNSNLNEMLHIASVCLKDASATENIDDVKDYLRSHHYNDGVYSMEMTQNIILIGSFEHDIEI